MFYHLITTKILIIKKFQIKRTIKVGRGNSWLYYFGTEVVVGSSWDRWIILLARAGSFRSTCWYVFSQFHCTSAAHLYVHHRVPAYSYVRNKNDGVSVELTHQFVQWKHTQPSTRYDMFYYYKSKYISIQIYFTRIYYI